MNQWNGLTGLMEPKPIHSKDMTFNSLCSRNTYAANHAIHELELTRWREKHEEHSIAKLTTVEGQAEGSNRRWQTMHNYGIEEDYVANHD